MRKEGVNLNKSVLILLFVLLIPLIYASSDVSVFQGQYFQGKDLQKGVYNFTFNIYDDKTSGSLIYSADRVLETGDWGQWSAELEGVSAAANDSSKDYFMDVVVDGVSQGERRRINNFNYIRKDVNDSTNSQINLVSSSMKRSEGSTINFFNDVASRFTITLLSSTDTSFPNALVFFHDKNGPIINTIGGLQDFMWRVNTGNDNNPNYINLMRLHSNGDLDVSRGLNVSEHIISNGRFVCLEDGTNCTFMQAFTDSMFVLNNSINNLNSITNNINSSVNDLRNANGNVNNSINSLFRSYSNLSSSIASVSSSLNDLSQQVAGIDSSQASLNNSLSELNGVVSSLETSVNNLGSVTSSTQSALDNLNTSVSTLNSNVNSLSGQVSSLSQEQSSLNGSVLTLSSSVSSLQTSVTSLSTASSNLQNSINALNSSVSSQIGSLSSGQTTLTNSVSSLSSSVSSLNTSVNSLANNRNIVASSANFTGTVNAGDVCAGGVCLSSLGGVGLNSVSSASAESTTIDKIINLEPSEAPLNPQEGNVYFDKTSKELKVYDGIEWKTLAYKTTTSTTESVTNTNAQWDCSLWGDCINGYQTRVCVNLNPNSVGATVPSQEQSCDSGFSLSGAAGTQVSGNTSGGSVTTETTTPSTTTDTTTAPSTDTTTTPTTETPTTTTPSTSTTTPSTTTTTSPTTTTTPSTETPAIPQQLFDITFNLDAPLISDSKQLGIVVTLQNFGTRYVPTRLIYRIYDSNNKLVYESQEEIRVYTDQSIVKNFNDLKLSPGKYNIKLSAEYAGITENFEKEFEIKGNFITEFFKNLFGK